MNIRNSLLILSTLLFMKTSFSQNENQAVHRTKTAVVAHRGGSLLAPENTMAAFRNAIAIGVDRIELDVHQTKDKVTVVMHDKSIDRTTNGKGLVSSMLYADLMKVDAGIKFSEKFTDEKIPTLDEVLSLIHGQCSVMIEIKTPDNASGDIEADVVKLVQKHDAYSWCVVQSFNFESVKKVHELDAKISMALLFVKTIYAKLKTDKEAIGFISEINIFHIFASKKVIDYIHALHKKVYVWTVDKPERMEKMIANGADGIITNNPKLLKDLMAQ